MAPRSRALQPGGLEVWFMKRNSCVMIIFLYFMDDVSMNSMARGHQRYRSGWLVTEVTVLLSFEVFFYNFLLRKHLAATFTEHMFWVRVYKTWKARNTLFLSYIKRKFCLVVSRCNLIDCDCMCISFGIRIDLDIYLTGKKKILFKF